VFGEEKNMAKTNVHVGPIRRFVLASSKDRFIPMDEFVSFYKHTHTIQYTRKYAVKHNISKIFFASAFFFKWEEDNIIFFPFI
jgi:hypothetical protein